MSTPPRDTSVLNEGIWNAWVVRGVQRDKEAAKTFHTMAMVIVLLGVVAALIVFVK